MTSTIKPVSFARGVPAEPKNGFYGIEEQLLSNPAEKITVIATYKVEDIIDKELSGERYPIVAIDHLEVLHDVEAIDIARKLQLAAHHQRTAGDQLEDFPELLHEPKLDLDSELADRDPGEDDAFEGDIVDTDSVTFEEGEDVVRDDDTFGCVLEVLEPNEAGVVLYRVLWDDNIEGRHPASELKRFVDEDEAAS